MSVVAPVRPDSWDFPLLLHVLGAMLLVGTLVLACSALLFAWRDGSASLVRLGYRSLLIGALPSWFLMRGSAEWIASKEGVADSSLAWVQIGVNTADLGFVLLAVSTLLAGLAAPASVPLAITHPSKIGSIQVVRQVDLYPRPGLRHSVASRCLSTWG